MLKFQQLILSQKEFLAKRLLLKLIKSKCLDNKKKIKNFWKRSQEMENLKGKRRRQRKILKNEKLSIMLQLLIKLMKRSRLSLKMEKLLKWRNLNQSMVFQRLNYMILPWKRNEMFKRCKFLWKSMPDYGNSFIINTQILAFQLIGMLLILISLNKNWIILT